MRATSILKPTFSVRVNFAAHRKHIYRRFNSEIVIRYITKIAQDVTNSIFHNEIDRVRL